MVHSLHVDHADYTLTLNTETKGGNVLVLVIPDVHINSVWKADQRLPSLLQSDGTYDEFWKSD